MTDIEILRGNPSPGPRRAEDGEPFPQHGSPSPFSEAVNASLFGNSRPSDSPTYNSWRHAKRRCRNPNNIKFNSYGGRGIKFDPRWDKFKAFLADMGVRPEGTSLDRIDPNGNYEPGNCRWATPKEQARNRKNNCLVKYQGELVTIAEVAERAGCSAAALHGRIFAAKMTIDEALRRPFRPIRAKPRRK